MGANDYSGVPDTSSDVSDTGSQPTQATPVSTPAATTPPVTNQPASTGDGSGGDPLLQETLKAYDSDRARLNEAQSFYDQMRKQISDINQQIAAAPRPQLPQHMEIPAPPDQQRQQNGNIGTILAHGVMLAGIASVIFGKHNNPWAAAAMYNGMAGFINGFDKAQHEQATEQLQNWNRSVEYAMKMNQEADRSYNEALANKRLDLTQQMDLIKTISAQRQDVEMYKAAASKDLNQVMRVLDQHMKASAASGRMQLDVNSRAAQMWLKGKVGNGWSMYVYEKSGGTLDPTSSNENLLKAMKQYPISEWMDSHTASGKDKKTAALSYDSLAKEATRVLGKDQATGWSKTLQGDEPFERGDVVEKTEEHPGVFGTPFFGSAPTKTKVWKPDANGTKYTFGEDDDAKLQNVQPRGVIDSLKAQYDKLRSSSGSQAKQGDQTESEDNLPTLTPQEASQYPSGTRFKGTDGNTYQVP